MIIPKGLRLIHDRKRINNSQAGKQILFFLAFDILFLYHNILDICPVF